MKTLLQINVVVNSGSTGKIAEEIGQKAITEGWKSYIAYGRRDRPSKSNLIKIDNLFDIILHGIESRLFDRHGLGSRAATKVLISKIELINPDIIHIHNIHGYYLNMKILFDYLSKKNIPVVWTLHDCWPITGHCSHFDFIGCNNWETECRDCPQIKEYPKSFFADRSKENYEIKKTLFNSVDDLTLIPVSIWLNKILHHSFLSSKTIKTIYNGIDLNIFSPKNDLDYLKNKYNITNKFIILGVASIWSPRKGLEDFIKLSSMISDKEQIILIGLTKKQISALPNNVIGIERTENTHQLAQFYSLADLFVNPTYEDNFPTTNLESLACGTPVVTYNTGGSIEAVDKETGFIIEKGSIEKVVYIIKQLRNSDKNTISEKCRNRAVLLYNNEDRYQEYIDLYNLELIRRKNNTLNNKII